MMLFAEDAVDHWYRRLLSRRIDLVGDYAGNELFLIEGDSLLLHCFSDVELDFADGFQLLHAAHNVEDFLQNILRRKCNFHIAFFDQHEPCCVPPFALPGNRPRYLLARAAIVRHLQKNLGMTQPRLRIELFQSLHCEEFAQYLEQTGIYFIMCHDGALPVPTEIGNIRNDSWNEGDESSTENGIGDSAGDASAGRANNDNSAWYINKAALRRMIYWFVGRGYNIALVNGIAWRDTKIITVVLEGHIHHHADLSSFATRTNLSREGKVSKNGSTSGISILKSIPQLIEAGSGGWDYFTERECFAVLTVAHMLLQDDSRAHTAAVFLLHIALLRHLSLSQRRFTHCPTVSGNEFLGDYARECLHFVTSWDVSTVVARRAIVCDIADLVDGRLFHACLGLKDPLSVDNKTQSLFESLVGAATELSSVRIFAPFMTVKTQVLHSKQFLQGNPATSGSQGTVLPFSNTVFDSHLISVQVSTDRATLDISAPASRVFLELSHWHNAKRPLDQKTAVALTMRQKTIALRRNQRFMSEMMAYAASLSNAVGKSLEPERIITATGGTKTPAPHGSKGPHLEEGMKQSKIDAKQDKKGPSKSGKRAILESIAAERATKKKADIHKHISAWHIMCEMIDKEQDPAVRYIKAVEHLRGLTGLKLAAVEAEVRLYMLNSLLIIWLRCCSDGKKAQGYDVAALLWYNIMKLTEVKEGLTRTIVAHVQSTIRSLELPQISLGISAAHDRSIPFIFALRSRLALDLSFGPSTKDFQLWHCGPYLDRNIDSAPDRRVPFEPDGWQRRVLDEIDAKRSLFVVAPTSAGKTFISFYAMKQVLEADDDGVLVYVAPTKALVNQIAAEVQARFSKTFKHARKSVWGIHTRDYRVNSPTGCQILVTVPHILQIMLLAPSNANSWSRRVKRIIFDEIHSIGQAEDGVVWEQLLLLAPCPIIALSATVGNPEEFNNWIASTQKSIGISLTMVQHHQRYSDLRKFIYKPPKKFLFKNLAERPVLAPLGLDGATGLAFMHPVASLVNRSRGLPDDLSLEARDCLTLWHSMVKHQSRGYCVDEALSPHKALPDVVRKVDIINWEAALKRVLKAWMSDNNGPFDAVLQDLSKTVHEQGRPEVQVEPRKTQVTTGAQPVDAEDLCATTLPLLAQLHAQDALPAILFNYDRTMCVKVCQALISQLESAERNWKESNPKWKAKVVAWEQWKERQEKEAKKPKDKSSKKSGRGSDGDERTSKLDLQKEAGDSDTNLFATFDPNAPVEGFRFADWKKLLPSELQVYCLQLEKHRLPSWLGEGLARGIGVHHAGMNRKYRQVVEILFRKGFLRVVIATGTLALGINMPCKSVVFSGDSVFLNALNFRQAAGRAGRRGFDMLGNVVFQGIPYAKVCRLLSSRLPDLNGHFPITTTLVLRLFALLHESKNSPFAVRVITSLLSQPRMYLGGDESKMTVLHHLRFSIEYLRRQQLLDSIGRPLNFAGCVSHLYFTENSNFAFHALLKEGYFQELCADIRHKPEKTLRTLMLVMSHLFGRRSCRQADQEWIEEVIKRSPSMVFLPPLPARAAAVLRQHNKQTLQVFITYVRTFVDQHIQHEDNQLPLTRMKYGGDPTSTSLTLPGTLPPTSIRSSFVALSGHSDDFETISDLCRTTRSGVFLEEAVIPYVGLYPEESDTPLNAYLYDFFKHGDITALDKANHVRRGDVWFLLNDFSLVLATIITSLMNFMKLAPESGIDLMDVMGSGDTFEEAKDDNVAELETESQIQPKDNAGRKQHALAERDAGKVADSWVDEADDIALGGLHISSGEAAESWEDDADATELEAAKRKAAAVTKQSESDTALPNVNLGSDLMNVLKAFQMLKHEFDTKFKVMWA